MLTMFYASSGHIRVSPLPHQLPFPTPGHYLSTPVDQRLAARCSSVELFVRTLSVSQVCTVWRRTNMLPTGKLASSPVCAPPLVCCAEHLPLRRARCKLSWEAGLITRLVGYLYFAGVFLYFSVGNAGFLRQRQSGAAKHVFAHVFAHAPSRSEAVPKLATALMEMVVLGDVVCDSKHLASILEQPEFLFTAHYAAWLNSESGWRWLQNALLY